MIFSFLLSLESLLLEDNLLILVIIITSEFSEGISLHFEVVPAKGTEAVGVVSLIEHLHGRHADYRIDIAGPMVDIALLFSVIVKNRLYSDCPFIFQKAENRLNRSIAHPKLLGKKGNLYRFFLPMHTYPIRDNRKSLVRSQLSKFPQWNVVFLTDSHVNETMMILRMIVTCNFKRAWIFHHLSH